jgi:lipoprotein-releasing system permease protein
MKLEWAICLRYLRAAWRGGPLSFITLVAGFGVALGVAALVVAMAVMNGYQANLLQAMSGALPHVSVYPGREPAFRDIAALKRSLVEAVHPRTVARYASLDALLRRADAPAAPMQALTLRGIEPEVEAGETSFLAYLDDGSPAWKTLPAAERLRQAARLLRRLDEVQKDGSVPVLISRSLATRLGVGIGSPVSPLEFPRAGGFVPLPLSKRLVVIGLFETGILAFDEAVALTGLRALERFAPPGRLEVSLGLRLERPLAASVAASVLRSLGLPNGEDIHVFSWLESNKGLFQVILLQKTMLFLVLMLIVLIASFGMISALVMLVSEKTREIAILKALGARERTVRRVFLLQGVLIGVVGLVGGLALGLVLCWGLDSFALFTIPPGVYPGSDRIPVLVALTDLLWVVLGTLLIAFGATQFPAFKAMRLKVVEGLRRE